jgi:hypothetical protein
MRGLEVSHHEKARIAHPQAVVPRREPGNVSGSHFSWTFQPTSVTKLEMELA